MAMLFVRAVNDCKQGHTCHLIIMVVQLLPTFAELHSFMLKIYISSITQPPHCTGSMTRRSSVNWWPRWGHPNSTPPPSLQFTTLRLVGVVPMEINSMSHWSPWLKTKVRITRRRCFYLQSLVSKGLWSLLAWLYLHNLSCLVVMVV